MTHAGTGKTVIAAFDYRNFRKKHPGEACRLLFVAHREEILTQSRDTFQGVLRDLNFGEMFVGNYVPENIDHPFINLVKKLGRYHLKNIILLSTVTRTTAIIRAVHDSAFGKTGTVFYLAFSPFFQASTEFHYIRFC